MQGALRTIDKRCTHLSHSHNQFQSFLSWMAVCEYTSRRHRKRKSRYCPPLPQSLSCSSPLSPLTTNEQSYVPHFFLPPTRLIHLSTQAPNGDSVDITIPDYQRPCFSTLFFPLWHAHIYKRRATAMSLEILIDRERAMDSVHLTTTTLNLRAVELLLDQKSRIKLIDSTCSLLYHEITWYFCE